MTIETQGHKATDEDSVSYFDESGFSGSLGDFTNPRQIWIDKVISLLSTKTRLKSIWQRLCSNSHHDMDILSNVIYHKIEDKSKQMEQCSKETISVEPDYSDLLKSAKKIKPKFNDLLFDIVENYKDNRQQYFNSLQKKLGENTLEPLEVSNNGKNEMRIREEGWEWWLLENNLLEPAQMSDVSLGVISTSKFDEMDDYEIYDRTETTPDVILMSIKAFRIYFH